MVRIPGYHRLRSRFHYLDVANMAWNWLGVVAGVAGTVVVVVVVMLVCREFAYRQVVSEQRAAIANVTADYLDEKTRAEELQIKATTLEVELQRSKDKEAPRELAALAPFIEQVKRDRQEEKEANQGGG